MYRPMFLVVATIIAAKSVASSPDYWDGPRVEKSSVPQTYIAAMHNRFNDIKSNYEESGKYYYGDSINSFGFREVLNPVEEVVFCGPGDQNFSDAINIASNAARPVVLSASTIGGVKVDSSGFTMSPQNMDDSIKQVLDNNSNTTAKGRFCYKTNDARVSYRQANSVHAVYCSSGQALAYTDEVSSFSCSLKLDVPLKVGKTRYVRQLQGSSPTVAQGFMGCYENPVSGVPELSLVENPDSCSPSSRGACTRTCDWAEDVVCNPADMPRWGSANQCGAYGTVMFKGDVLQVESSNALSYDEASGALFKGTANFACAMIFDSASGKEKAKWIVTASSCGVSP